MLTKALPSRAQNPNGDCRGDLPVLGRGTHLQGMLFRHRCNSLTDSDGNQRKQEPGLQRGIDDALNRDTGGSHRDELRTTGQCTQANQSTDQGRNRKELIRIARHTQGDELQSIQEKVVTLPDTIHFVRQDKESQQRQQHGKGERGAAQYSAAQITVQNSQGSIPRKKG